MSNACAERLKSDGKASSIAQSHITSNSQAHFDAPCALIEDLGKHQLWAGCVTIAVPYHPRAP